MERNSLFNPKWKKANNRLLTKAYYFKTWDGYQMPALHCHSSIEIMYVINGKCYIEIKNEKKVLGKGQFIMIDSNIKHRLIVPQGHKCRMLNIEFGFDDDQKMTFGFRQMVEEEASIKHFIENPFSYLILHDTDIVYVTLKKLIYYLDVNKEKKALFIQLLHFELLADIAHLWEDSLLYKKSNNETYVYKALEYIHQHYDENIKISQLAHYVSLNENYLQRLFKEQMQVTIIEYLNGFRLEKAAMFLSETDYSILEICDLTGINSRQYFIKLFKDRFSLTPGVYRKSTSKLHGHEISE